ncbi:ABC transporter substrate-binding protein [Enterovirga rhinocerotis]|uniref:Iron complex transport system substrate-binding protein n=1 Tax=Enterovirga rhinocerotis TaxID=1339210 RepID=A0A4R7C9B3_9HYPH|nr:ABC transporter substrate-binding protein [Enterovirga rhinocerotis]TDR93496.1 iron complex transport system substrate-binding protein [Enterovirga rhinocerotis]
MMRAHLLALAAIGLLAGSLGAVAQTYPVEVESCFDRVRFDGPPKRALVNDTNMVQTILDLGLADRIVGVSGIRGVERHLVGDPKVIAGLNQFIDRYPSLEAVLGLDPDFMFAGWSYGFRASTGLTPASLATMGVKTYVLRESCIRIGKREPIGMETLYADIAALGALFGIRERAEAVIAAQKARVAAVADRLQGVPSRPRVMYCDDCYSPSPPLSVGREGMTALIIRLGGGESLFDDIANSYVRVNWEEVAKRDPQWIIVNDHRVPIEQTIRHLLSDPQLSHVEAIRERRFIPLTYAEQTPSTRSIDGLEKIARALHPDRFR